LSACGLALYWRCDLRGRAVLFFSARMRAVSEAVQVCRRNTQARVPVCALRADERSIRRVAAVRSHALGDERRETPGAALARCVRRRASVLE
jgi:hypothetical protein